MEESRAEQRAEVIGNLAEGMDAEGVVKNITEYGAFVDLGGVDGLLHVTDMAWRRINHPSEILTIGQSIKVQVIKINKDTHRISLGMKQLEEDPWSIVETKYPLESTHKGVVTNITDYGAFVELEAGVEGLVHVSEISWTKHIKNPSEVYNMGDNVDAKVLSIDIEDKKISLGVKQLTPDPWDEIEEKYMVGTVHKAINQNLTQRVFGQLACLLLI